MPNGAPPTLILVDCDGDTRSANGANDWPNVESCLEDIKHGITTGCEAAEYLPWRVVDGGSAENICDMTIYETIEGMTVELHMLGRGADAVAASCGDGKVKRRVK